MCVSRTLDCATVLVAGLILLSAAHAEDCPATWDVSMAQPGPAGLVFAFARLEQDEQSLLYVAGQFTEVGETDANHIAAWDGRDWMPLGDGVHGDVSTLGTVIRALAVFDDGSGPALYAGGSFAKAGSIDASGIAKWDGSRWSSLGPGFTKDTTGSGPTVFDLAGFDDGGGPALYAVGHFLNAGKQNINHVAKWNGTAWEPLGSGFDESATPQALAVFDDGSGPALYVGGAFVSAGGASDTVCIARWNGTDWSSVGGGADGPVFSLEVFDDGTGPALYAGGNFTAAGGVATGRIARWDGEAWSSVGHASAIGSVWTMAGFDDGGGPALYAAGSLTSSGPWIEQPLIKWDGSEWSAVQPGIGSDEAGGVLTLRVLDDDAEPSLHVGGWFASAGDLPTDNMAVMHMCPGPLPGDLTGDGTVGVDDLLLLLVAWGSCDDCADCPADLSNDCTVGVDDLLILLANWS